MSNDPYAAPSAELHANDAAVETSMWTATGRLSVLSYLGQSLLLIIASGLAFTALILAFAAAFGGLENAANMLENLDNVEDMAFLESMPVLPLLGLFVLLMIALYFSTCLLIKRLHDRGHSGWWALPLIIVSLIPVLAILSIIPYLYLLFWPGQKRANRFGGQRATKGWEKLLGIIFIILILLPLIALGVILVTSGGAALLPAGALGS